MRNKTGIGGLAFLGMMFIGIGIDNIMLGMGIGFIAMAMFYGYDYLSNK